MLNGSFVRTDRLDRPLNQEGERVDSAKPELLLVKLSLLRKNGPFGHAQLSQSGRTDAFHLRTGWTSRSVLADGGRP